MFRVLSKHPRKINKNLPPSPGLSLPIIGHLYLIKKPVRQTLANLSNKYIRLYKGSKGGEFMTNDAKSTFFYLTLNVIMRMIAGKRYHGENPAELGESRKVKEIVTETFELSGATNTGDFVPVLKWFEMNHNEKRLAILHSKRDKFLQDLIEAHRGVKDGSASDQGSSKTTIDILLALQETEPEFFTYEIIRSMMTVSTHYT
nr:cytochrome P450 81Q32-like [Populus alba]